MVHQFCSHVISTSLFQISCRKIQRKWHKFHLEKHGFFTLHFPVSLNFRIVLRRILCVLLLAFCISLTLFPFPFFYSHNFLFSLFAFHTQPILTPPSKTIIKTIIKKPSDILMLWFTSLKDEVKISSIDFVSRYRS